MCFALPMCFAKRPHIVWAAEHDLNSADSRVSIEDLIVKVILARPWIRVHDRKVIQLTIDLSVATIDRVPQAWQRWIVGDRFAAGRQEVSVNQINGNIPVVDRLATLCQQLGLCFDSYRV